jgi:uncharacterized protein (TIGR01777 family)
MYKTILITGASGLIGKSLTEMLLKKGYIIHHLSRAGSHDNPEIKTFKWDVFNSIIDENCIKGVDAIIHLAGENIGDKRWTKKRKARIIESRTESIRMLYNLLRKNNHNIKTVISASAVGYYGDQGDKVLDEASPPGNDFAARVCIEWEKAVDEGRALGLRVVKLRTAIVLDKEEGALRQLALPIKYGFGAPLGSGKQWIPWIHLTDCTGIYLFALENNLQGIYNMTAPYPVINKELTKAIAKELKKPLWLPNIPGFFLKIILGEMGEAVLSSAMVSADKILSAGFEFKFPHLKEALQDIYQTPVN